ncbi:hypothetical protein C8R46DRAFT_1229291 [Mycena filopes]|nr:hypothetical protein C8R46DRAFT_1229291 [Mycena filopes]
MTRRYMATGSLPFVSDNVFQTAWFSFSSLQVFRDDMVCPDCGPHPEDTIWDGVMLAFSRKNLLASLCPPTTVLDQAPEHASHYVYKQAFLVDADLRKSLHNIIGSPFTVARGNSMEVEGVDIEEEKVRVDAAKVKAYRDVTARINAIPATAITAKVTVPKCYKELFAQMGMKSRPVIILA